LGQNAALLTLRAVWPSEALDGSCLQSPTQNGRSARLLAHHPAADCAVAARPGAARHGVIAIADPVKATTKAAIDEHKASAIHFVMRTGDNKTTAEAVARKLGIDDVHAALLPDDKHRVVAKPKADGRNRGGDPATLALMSLNSPRGSSDIRLTISGVFPVMKISPGPTGRPHGNDAAPPCSGGNWNLSCHAAACLPQRNSLPSAHMRCRITESLRATATRARAMPRRLAMAMP